METPQLNKTLQDLVGHLVIETKDQQQNLRTLSDSLAKSELSGDPVDLRSRKFNFEKSDIFFEGKILKDRISSIDQLAEKRSKDKNDPEYKLYVREVPVREQLIYGSVPNWAAGAKLDHSVGPFVNKDGRNYWFDFYPIEKLVALYLQGVAEPVLLFKDKVTIEAKEKLEADKGRVLKSANADRIVVKTPPVVTRNPPTTNPLKTYNLQSGSIWVLSRFLASNAPVATYTGLTIKSGKVTLSNLPTLVNGKLTAPANTIIALELNLTQPKVTDADQSNPYGSDARVMEVQLPQTLNFHFTNASKSMDEVGGASWQLYGQANTFEWNKSEQPTYNAQVQRILIPFTASEHNLVVEQSTSPFNKTNNQAAITKSSWALQIATINILQPNTADGIGAMLVQCGAGISCNWSGMQGTGYSLASPMFLVAPGQLVIANQNGENPHLTHSLNLWKDSLNPFGTTVELTFNIPAPFFYVSNAIGAELLMTLTNADYRIDRPVKVNGEPPKVKSLNSLLILAVTQTNRLIYLLDDNLIQDEAQANNVDPIIPRKISLALNNALFKVTQANGCLLFGTLSEDFIKVDQGFLFLSFGLYNYLPILPDPYAANLGITQLRDGIDPATGAAGGPPFSTETIGSWLVCRVYWNIPQDESENDSVEVSFHFAPYNNQFGGISFEVEEEDEENSSPAESAGSLAASAVDNTGYLSSNANLSSINHGFSMVRGNEEDTRNAETNTRSVSTTASTAAATTDGHSKPLPPYEDYWNEITDRYRRNMFALLDVSTNADLYGISFNLVSSREKFVTTHAAVSSSGYHFPLTVKGMDVMSPGTNVKAFTVPQISWEPTINLTKPVPNSGDPHEGPNYYPDDGGPTQIMNNSDDEVTLAPIPNNQFLANHMEQDEDFAALSFFTLPFGMKALALLQKKYDSGNGNTRRGGILKLASEEFDEMKAAVQLSMIGGKAQAKEESDMFAGRTVQLANVLELDGTPPPVFPKSTLGESVTEIFNNEFWMPSGGIAIQRGVPLERMDLSGYGASAFSNWLNPKAAIAETSQAKFDIFIGRCAHEVIQVKSLMYPWGIKVVRTITLFRVGSGYVYRFDTGWRAESDGEFKFRYYTKKDDGTGFFDSIPHFADFRISPGIVKGLYNVKDIVETKEIEEFISKVEPEFLLNEATGEATENVGGILKDVELQPVYFNADIEIENPVSGFNLKKFIITNEQGQPIDEIERKVVPSKKILGFVQIAPRGVPITSPVLRELVTKHATIGAAIDCEVSLANSSQRMRLNRFDFNNSFGANGSDITFAVAGRGSVLLPKDGSWSMVKHERGTGNVSPVPKNISVPVIRKGELVPDLVTETMNLSVNPNSTLVRIANPTELERQPTNDTLNFGFLQSMDTQKALFLTPSFQSGIKKLCSKTPPLFVDTMRIVNSKGIFPNIGNAESDIGEAISLIQSGTEFAQGALLDEGNPVWELMDVADEIDSVKQVGYQLLKKLPVDVPFTIPDASFNLIDLGPGNFRIYIEYKDKNSNQGNIDFNIDSLAGNIEDTWKSKMGNIGLVADLAGIDRLMTIRGSWDSKKGAEASYPQPEIEFSPELQPVIDILEILQKLQGADYAGAVASGLKLAMSNKAGSWEYKFEASKEIPVLRFPVPDAVYNDPNTPFKLECGLTIGAYFNAALKVTTDTSELLPSAGGSLGFYGRLSVMCVSVSAATVYAIGQVDLTIAADTKIGPSLRMKFGFGAQIVVGLPVAGNVSVLFVTGVEIFVAEGLFDVTAFMRFEGHAEILGGIVSITIVIEAKGTISKKSLGSGDGSRTDLVCQVTFSIDISIFLIINIHASYGWTENRQLN